jgi:hypothetical protein
LAIILSTDNLVSISLQKLKRSFEILLYASPIVRMMSKLLVVLVLMVAVIASIVGTTLPAANALVTRDFAYLNDNHITALYGNTMVCGDHMCAPGEWDKLQASLTAAQLGHQGGRNATQTGGVPSASTTAAPTTAPTGATPKVCEVVKTMLNSAGVSPSVVSQVMADLSCS